MEIGVLKPIQESDWAFPSFKIPEKPKDPGKPGTVQFMCDLRELNKQVVQKPYRDQQFLPYFRNMKAFSMQLP